MIRSNRKICIQLISTGEYLTQENKWSSANVDAKDFASLLEAVQWGRNLQLAECEAVMDLGGPQFDVKLRI